MYIHDGMVYAGEPKKILKVVSAKPEENFRLRVRFSTDGTKLFDFTPLLEKPVFAVLKDISVFSDLALDHGVPFWCGGSADIAPEWLHEDGIPLEG